MLLVPVPMKGTAEKTGEADFSKSNNRRKRENGCINWKYFGAQSKDVEGSSLWYKDTLCCVIELLSQCQPGWDSTQRAELLCFLLNRSPFMIYYLTFYVTTLSLKILEEDVISIC